MKSKLKLVWTPFPTLLFYTELTKGGRVAGDAKYFLARVDNSRKDDLGIHAHEYRHVTHWWCVTLLVLFLVGLTHMFVYPLTPTGWLAALVVSTALYNVLTTLVPRARLFAELDCYRVQLKVNGTLKHAGTYAKIIRERYGLEKYPESWIQFVLEKGFDKK